MRLDGEVLYELIDTPGLLSPAIAHESDGLMLAASHLIGPESYSDEVVATFLAEILLERYPGLVRTRYGFDLLRHRQTLASARQVARAANGSGL